jgi:hypothetical protein
MEFVQNAQQASILIKRRIARLFHKHVPTSIQPMKYADLVIKAMF